MGKKKVKEDQGEYPKVHSLPQTGNRWHWMVVLDEYSFGFVSGLRQFEDPFGHRWDVSTHVEDVPPEEMSKRAAAAMSAG